MRVALRGKLMTIVGVAALSSILLIVASTFISYRVERQLSAIQNAYLPKVELGPQLENSFERLRRGFQDAVGARDSEALAETRNLRRAFLDQLAAAHGAIAPADQVAVRAAVEDYYVTAYDLSRRLIANETGEPILGAMTAMQRKRARCAELLKNATAFDRRELNDAFTAARQAVVVGRASGLWISAACAISVILLSTWLGNGVLRSLASLTSGLRRFGEGDFGVPIRVVSRDGLEELAQQANQMAASLDRMGRESKKAEEKFRALMESAPDAMVIVDKDGRIVLVNAQTESLFGYARDAVLGEPLKVLVPERPPAEDSYGRRKDGSAFPIETRSSPLDTADGALVSIAIRDSTDRKTAEMALKVANRELEAFSYSVAHDLRAPLRAMNGFARLLLDTYVDALDAEGQDWQREIDLNAVKMGGLIDALLSLARVTRSELKAERVDLSAIVRGAASQLAAAEPHRSVDVVVQDDVLATVDPQLARALVENLVGNAWKFTSKVSAARIEFGTTEHDGERVFFVRDNGAGFDMAYFSKLFGAFQRLHTEAEFSGTGIGLASVQRIVHRHGGRIWAEGSVNGGATFFLTLPGKPIGATP
jgi:signal transduction histidine kinase